MPIFIIAPLKQKNGSDFPIVDAVDVAFKEGRLTDYMPEAMSKEAYEELKAAGKVIMTKPYLIYKEE